MSLELINVGTEPNDGTGDPPRQAALKMNANFQALNAALADTETTAQLDSRDTANRARENHTGTQAASTITGLAPVATSGAYGDLSGKPAQALTYDQTAEPSSPSPGQVWRERSGGGLIIGEWEWSGLFWVGLVTRATQEARSSISVTSQNTWTGLLIPRINRFTKVLVQDCVLNWASSSVPVVWDLDNHYSFSVLGRSNNLGGAGVVGDAFTGSNIGSTITQSGGRSIAITIPVNTAYDLPGPTDSALALVRFRVDAIKVGAAPDLLNPMATINYRGIR